MLVFQQQSWAASLSKKTDLGSGQVADILHSMQTALVTYRHEVLMFMLRICNPKLRIGKAC
jgi:hypothetical protein